MQNHMHHMLTRAEIKTVFRDWSDAAAPDFEITDQVAESIFYIQLFGRAHGRKGWYPNGDFATDADWCYGVGVSIRDLESALEIDDGSIGRLYEDAHSAYFADGTINPSDRNGTFSNEQGIYDLRFGAYADVRVSVHAASADDALELAAEWLAEHEPGHFIEPDYAAAAKELGLAWPTDNEQEGEAIQSAAEADLTYTESGWLAQLEWTVDGPR